MTTDQIELALKMKESGMDWQFIANYFNVNRATLLRYRKHYEQHQQNS